MVQNRTVEPEEQRSALRGAFYRADGPAVVDLAPEVLQGADALQLLGDGLLAAIDQHTEGATEFGSACATMLRQRDWDGDELLADHLDGLIGSGPPALSPLPVDLEVLASILEGDFVNGGGRIDRWTGEVWPQVAIEYAVEIGDEEEEGKSDDSDRWLRVECQGSADAYRDMELFVGTVGDARAAGRLAAALEGRGAFRRFKEALGAWPAERHRWYAYSEERQRGRARAWLAESGYCVSATPES